MPKINIIISNLVRNILIGYLYQYNFECEDIGNSFYIN